MSLRAFLRERGEVARWRAAPAAARQLVFYAEDGGSWPHLGPLVTELLARGRPLVYLTSDAGDPVLARAEPGLHAFAIGAGVVRTAAFVGLDARVCVMTMPELGCSYIKRSRARPVHYVYVFHSIVSTHMVYRPGAFDHYDTVLCVGPHHEREIRATEARSGLRAKALVPHGYGRLDAILAERAAGCGGGGGSGGAAVARGARGGGPPRVLVAPSWGPDGLVESLGARALAPLLEAGMLVTLRPHPVTRQRFGDALERVQAALGGHVRFALDEDVASSRSLHAADVLVSDWSGAALEYAFGRERPVLFVDLPRKVNNPGWTALGIEPLEAAVRAEIGAVVAPDRLDELPAAVERLLADPGALAARIAAARERHVYHVGHSAQVGADAVERLLASPPGAP